jgi:uncharacterized protein YcbK (DUF882 family)
LTSRRSGPLFALALALLFLMARGGPASAGGTHHHHIASHHRGKALARHASSHHHHRRLVHGHPSHVVCHHHGKHRSCHRISNFTGHGVPADELRTDPLPTPSGNVWIYAENFREEVKVNIYRPGGGFDEAALAQLDHLFRCKRTDEERAVDPRVYETLSRIQDHFEGKRAVLISGFRFAERHSSRHFHASAMDIRVEGVPLDTLYSYAESLDPGGMGLGIYPTTQFIHVDYRAPGDPSYRWVDVSGHGGAPPPRHHHPTHHKRTTS